MGFAERKRVPLFRGAPGSPFGMRLFFTSRQRNSSAPSEVLDLLLANRAPLLSRNASVTMPVARRYQREVRPTCGLDDESVIATRMLAPVGSSFQVI